MSTKIAAWTLRPGVFSSHTVDLSRWSGQSVTLALASEAGGHAHGDHVFVGEPVVSSRKAKPKRVVLVFLDTVRPDRLSLYGAQRDTSGALDSGLRADGGETDSA